MNHFSSDGHVDLDSMTDEQRSLIEVAGFPATSSHQSVRPIQPVHEPVQVNMGPVWHAASQFWSED